MMTPAVRPGKRGVTSAIRATSDGAQSRPARVPRGYALPGRVSFEGSSSRRASAGVRPPSAAARSTIERPVFTDAFTISAARA